MTSFLRNISFLLLGTRRFTKNGFLKAASNFDNSCMSRSLAGKVCIVTGANAGLGLETSKELARHGAVLYMVCRSEARGQAAVEAVRADSNNPDVHLEVCDISSLSSIAAFAQRWTSAGRPCHLLVNNAGVLLNQRCLTPEGFEASFATNTLGTAALTHYLLPALTAAAPSRVILVSSGGMYTAQLWLDDFAHQTIQPWDGSAAYARDKRRQVALAEHLSASLADQGVAVYSMHPGWSDTEGVRTSIPGFYKMFRNQLRSPKEGVDTILWLALEDGSRLQPGAFYLDRTPQAKHLPLAGTSYTPAQAAQLWTQLVQLAASNSNAGTSPDRSSLTS